MSTAPWPRASRLILEETHIWDQLKNERPTSNIERPTSNNVSCPSRASQGRTVNLKRLSKPSPLKEDSSIRLSLNRQSVASSLFNVRCWAFDVRRSIWSLFRPDGISYEVS
jgi:hypothetical protein